MPNILLQCCIILRQIHTVPVLTMYCTLYPQSTYIPRIQQGLAPSSELGLPNPSPASDCAGTTGEGYTPACMWGGGGVPNRTIIDNQQLQFTP